MTDRKASEAARSHAIPAPSFPTHNSPRTWFLTNGLSPLAVRLVRLLLAHGDYVVVCLPPHELADDERSAEFRELAQECGGGGGGGGGGGVDAKTGRRRDWKDRIRGIRCDGRMMGQCAAAVAEAVHVFGRIDILLCCHSQVVVGSVEEIGMQKEEDDGEGPIRDQFETSFFSQVNFIRASLPQLREQRTGHVLVLSSVAGHLGTPGIPVYSAATWALEGYCDSLAYEIAPFNVKVTIVQPNLEVAALTSKLVLTATTEGATDTTEANEGTEDKERNLASAHGFRNVLQRVLDVDPTRAATTYAKLSSAALDRLVLETVHALTAIGGHENPPARHIVGFEASAAVQDKLKTVSEELEDFVEASLSVDIFASELQAEARRGGGGGGGGDEGKA